MAMGTTLQQNYFLPGTNSSVDANVGHGANGGNGPVKIEARASPSLSPLGGDNLQGEHDDNNGDRDGPSPFQFHIDDNAQTTYQQQLILEQQHQQQLLRHHLLQGGYPSSGASSPFAFKLQQPSSGFGHGATQSHDANSHHASGSSSNPFGFGSSHPQSANPTPQPPPSASSSNASSSTNSLFSVNGRGAASPAGSDPSSTGGDSVVVGAGSGHSQAIATPAPLYRFGSSSQNIGSHTLTHPSTHNYNYASAYASSAPHLHPQAGQQRQSPASSQSAGFSSSSNAGGSAGNSPRGWTAQQQHSFLAQQQQQQLRYQQQQLRLQQQLNLANSQFLGSKSHTNGTGVGQHLGNQHLSNNTHHHPNIAHSQPHHQLSSSNPLHHQQSQQAPLHHSHHPSGLAHTRQTTTPLPHPPNHAHSHFPPSHHTLAHRLSNGSLNGIPMSYSDEYEGYNEFDDVNEIPASELGATFAGLSSGGASMHPAGGISLGGSMGDDREALRQRDRARDREEREREMERGMSERERTIRRRSSKACDQCRKSKCKCERASPNEPCKNCVMLGTPCTFLGPSRKRGPPKGYIDAIEARLHQTEALLGIMLSTRDERARSLLKDIGKDPLAREIITRVDNSPYGVKGRKNNGSLGAKGSARTPASGSGTMSTLLATGPTEGSGFVADDEDDEGDAKMDDLLVLAEHEGDAEPGKIDLTSTHPSNEWQDRVSSMLDAQAAKIAAVARGNAPSRTGVHTHTHTNAVASSPPDPSGSHADSSNSGNNNPPHSQHPHQHPDDHADTGRRTRRRVGEAEYDVAEGDRDLTGSASYSTSMQGRESADGAFRADRDRDSINSNVNMLHNKRSPAFQSGSSARRHQPSRGSMDLGDASGDQEHHPRSPNVPSSTTRLLNRSRSRINMHRGYANPSHRTPTTSDSDDSDNLEGALGKLSINEDDQVRYHGKASGLYLLAATSGDGTRSGQDPRTGLAAASNDPRSSPETDADAEGQRPRRGRREDGIWQFPKARVWPPLPSSTEDVTSTHMSGVSVDKLQYAPSLRQNAASAGGKNANVAILPPREVQDHLLALYFAHVQPVFPIIHKKAFWEGYHVLMELIDPGNNYESPSMPSQMNKAPSSKGKKCKQVSALLLFAMFAVASRYDERFSPSKPADPSSAIWTSGDVYLDRAHKELGATHGVSHGRASGHCPETVQALLLLGYREIGIGAMAQAWGYIGWGVRMSQDLGMHRSADGWERIDVEPTSEKGTDAAPAGSRKRQPIFTAQELNERKRIWYGCIIMDTYASTHIGRPLMIFEWDYDTPLPDPEEDSGETEKESLDNSRRVNEEWEAWAPEQIPGSHTSRRTLPEQILSSEGMPSRSISCFNAAAILSGILGTILQTVYAVRPVSSRHAESIVLEGVLDRWYLTLPEHLRFEPTACARALSVLFDLKSPGQGTSSMTPIRVPPTHVLMLHMHYWCAVLLLHRPFIRQVVTGARAQASLATSQGSDSQGGKAPGQPGTKPEMETRAVAEKSFELCIAASNHIASLATLYQEVYVISHCPAFMNFYVFTAAITHDITLAVRPGDPQARTALQRCMHALRAISTEWPSASRALELFGRSRPGSDQNQPPRISNNPDASLQNKRAANYEIEASHTYDSDAASQSQRTQGWPSTNRSTPTGVVHVASTHPVQPSANLMAMAVSPLDGIQPIPAPPMQPPQSYQHQQPPQLGAQRVVYPPPELLRNERAMSILSGSSGANDFYRLHPPQSSSKLDVHAKTNQNYQQPSSYPHYSGKDSNVTSWQPPPGHTVPAQDFATLHSTFHSMDSSLSMTALPHIYHNTGIVDHQSGAVGFPPASLEPQQHEQYLPQRHYVQHPSTSSFVAHSSSTQRHPQPLSAQSYSAFESYDPSYVPQTNILGNPQRPQSQDGTQTSDQGFGMYNNPQFFNNQ